MPKPKNMSRSGKAPPRKLHAFWAGNVQKQKKTGRKAEKVKISDSFSVEIEEKDKEKYEGHFVISPIERGKLREMPDLCEKLSSSEPQFFIIFADRGNGIQSSMKYPRKDAESVANAFGKTLPYWGEETVAGIFTIRPCGRK